MKSLANVKVGDEVAWGKREILEGRSRILTITKITATQFVCGSLRFKRPYGREIGGGRTRFYISADPRDIAAVKSKLAKEREETQRHDDDEARKKADPRYQAANRLSGLFGIYGPEEIAERFTLDQLRNALAALGIEA